MLKRKSKEAIFVHLMVAYPLLQFFIFYIGINFNSVLLAVKFYNIDTANFDFLPASNFLFNFKNVTHDLIYDSVVRGSLGISAIHYAVSLFISIPLSIFSSFCIYKKVPAAGFFKTVLFLPSIISGIVLILTFKYFVEYAVPQIAESFFDIKNFPMLLIDKRYALLMQILYGLWIGFGGNIILYTNAMSKIPDSLTEYGKIEGMNAMQELRHLVLPFIYPTLTTFLVLSVVGFFVSQGSLYGFYSANAPTYTYTVGYYFFIKVFGSKSTFFEHPYAAASGLIFTLIAAPLTLLVKYLLEKFGPQIEA